jgi:flagellin
MIINTNISALNTLNQLNANTTATQSSLEKLSSGLRINKAADDSAGLAISEKMKAQIGGLDQASSNAQNGISMIQTAEGSLSESQSILQRMNDLAVEAQNGTNSTTDTSRLQDEADQLAKDLDRISNNTQFNTMNVLGTGGQANSLLSASGISLQIGANAGQTITISLSGVTLGSGGSLVTSVTAAGLGVSSTTAVGESDAAIDLTSSGAITSIQTAIDTISALRSKLGAFQNRLDDTIDNLGVESENLTSAQSSIADVDMAAEMTNYTKNNILVQSAEAMLSQANQLPQGVLSLLK